MLIVLGGLISLGGYNLRNQLVTVTITQSITASSTIVSSIGNMVTTMTKMNPIVTDQFTIPGKAGTQYCATLNSDQENRDWRALNPGSIHVSFSTTGGGVNFWILSQSQYTTYSTPGTTCAAALAMPSIITLGSTPFYDDTVQIPSLGYYAFVFRNINQGPVQVTFEVDYTQVGSTTTALYSTQTTTFPTQQISSVLQPAGLRAGFYFGVILLIIGIVIAIRVFTKYKLKLTPKR